MCHNRQMEYIDGNRLEQDENPRRIKRKEELQ